MVRPDSCSTSSRLLQLLTMQPLPATKKTDQGRHAVSCNCDGEDCFETGHVRLFDDGHLLGSERLLDLCSTCTQNDAWIDFRELCGKLLQDLIVEAALSC